MNIMITGRSGQVGWELERELRPLGVVMAFDRASLDLADPDALVRGVREHKPHLIVNAAAYTAVDRAEAEPEKAYAANARGPAVLAEEAKRLGALLVHYSTDYVFDGSKAEPYVEEDEPRPLGVYGASKLCGERAIQAAGCRYLILRTSWVYGARGRNFLLTMLRLAREREELQVVDDQTGSPTWCRVIAQTTGELLQRRAWEDSGLMHLACKGYASWFQFASDILSQTASWRQRQPALTPIASHQYPTPARRPANTRLATARLERALGQELPHWRDSLSRCLASFEAPGGRP
jgi:dTDP-4-dehydrorhamnose reductase